MSFIYLIIMGIALAFHTTLAAQVVITFFACALTVFSLVFGWTRYMLPSLIVDKTTALYTLGGAGSVPSKTNLQKVIKMQKFSGYIWPVIIHCGIAFGLYVTGFFFAAAIQLIFLFLLMSILDKSGKLLYHYYPEADELLNDDEEQ